MDKGLSRDVLIVILKQLSIQNLLNASLTCHLLNELCEPLIYACLHLNWAELDEIATNYIDNREVDRRIYHLRKLIIAADSRGEWVVSPKLAVVDEICLNSLEILEIKCALKSSGWLKYIKSPLLGVRSLHLTVSGPFQNQSFDFAHVSDTFPNLNSIRLGGDEGGFTIDPYPGAGLKYLQSIDAQNCEWHYPSKLTDAAANSNLKALSIRFSTHMHPFAFSERLRAEFSSLPQSLEELKIDIAIGRRLSWNPLKRCPPLKNLRTAELHGFDYVYRDENENENGSTKFPKLVSLHEY